jgi:preprotein translocase subunit SecA
MMPAKQLLQYDDVMRQQRETMYEERDYHSGE